jgi:telomerase-binding protein EST1A
LTNQLIAVKRTDDDIWSLLSEFLTTLSDVNTRSVKLLPTKFEGCEQIILPEDGMLSGFIPLLGAPHSLSFIQPPFDKVSIAYLYNLISKKF